jgi:pimeloyl-ACP methyl ester carboxylesterase
MEGAGYQHVKSHIVPSRDINLYLESNFPKTDKQADSAGQDTVVFLHGYPDYLETWSNQINFLKKEFRVVSFDLRGVHKSGAPLERSGYVPERYLDDLETVLNFAVGEGGKVFLTGHDLGALICWLFVARPENRQRVKGFTAIACPHPSIAADNIKRWLTNNSIDQYLYFFKQFFKTTHLWFFQIPLIPEIIWHSFPEKIWRTIYNLGGISSGDEILDLCREEILSIVLNPINFYREFLNYQLAGIPGLNIDIPVQIIVPLYDMANNPEIYHGTSEFVKNPEIHYIPANHWLHREKPEVVNALLFKFIEKFN